MPFTHQKKEAGAILTDDLSLGSSGNRVFMVTNVGAGPSGF